METLSYYALHLSLLNTAVYCQVGYIYPLLHIASYHTAVNCELVAIEACVNAALEICPVLRVLPLF